MELWIIVYLPSATTEILNDEKKITDACIEEAFTQITRNVVFVNVSLTHFPYVCVDMESNILSATSKELQNRIDMHEMINAFSFTVILWKRNSYIKFRIPYL